jgi:hypothetical protein
MFCDSRYGPCFSDISLGDYCNASTRNFGLAYTNDTGLRGSIVLTGSHWFQEDGEFKVKEIEVFEFSTARLGSTKVAHVKKK